MSTHNRTHRHDRALLAARAAENGFTGRNSGPVGIDLSRRTATVPQRRTTSRIRKGKRPGGDKGQDLWRSTSPYYKTVATIDSRWSA